MVQPAAFAGVVQHGVHATAASAGNTPTSGSSSGRHVDMRQLVVGQREASDAPASSSCG